MGDFPLSLGWILTDRTENGRFSRQIRSGWLNIGFSASTTHRFWVQGAETRHRLVTCVGLASSRVELDSLGGWVRFRFCLDTHTTNTKRASIS